jgi:predicted transcriptional regulator
MAEVDQSNLTSLTVDLLSAYVANNTVEHGVLSELIKSTHAALKVIDAPEPAVPDEPEYKPAVSARKSLSSDSHIISLIDGKPYQTLKRHLSKHGLTAEQYRERYGLAKTYPMVAKAYSESRRAIAEKLGLGRRVKGAQAEAAPAETPVGLAADPKTDTPAKTKLSSARAQKSVVAKADAAAPRKAKAASKAGSSARTDAPVKTKAPASKTTTTPAPDAPAADSPATPTPKARKAATPKPDSSRASATDRTAPRKRSAKTAAPAS